jgi:hypothetical protein
VIGLIQFGQNHLCVNMLFNRDSAIQKCFRKILQSQKSRFPASRPDEVSSRPDIHLSTVPSVRTPNKPSIILLEDVEFRPDLSLCREAFVPACIRPDVSVARPDSFQYSTKFQILSKFK